MLKSKLALGCLTALGMMLASVAVHAEEENAYTVIVKKVSVEKTNAQGESWDAGDGDPDLAVIIRNTSEADSKPFETKTVDDAFSADFDTPSTIKVRADQTLQFEVVDKDVALNDTIGKIEKKMTAEVLGEKTLKLEKFGRVITLEVEIKKL